MNIIYDEYLAIFASFLLITNVLQKKFFTTSSHLTNGFDWLRFNEK